MTYATRVNSLQSNTLARASYFAKKKFWRSITEARDVQIDHSHTLYCIFN